MHILEGRDHYVQGIYESEIVSTISIDWWLSLGKSVGEECTYYRETLEIAKQENYNYCSDYTLVLVETTPLWHQLEADWCPTFILSYKHKLVNLDNPTNFMCMEYEHHKH